ncbi:MAG: hypothetical protein HZB46_18690 [Solirubrobacterales bacterium]|nr:hypothetical protein [Solirubrobacterales bacterium]
MRAARSGTGGDDSKLRPAIPGAAIGRSGLVAIGAIGAVLLVAATFSTIIEITVGTTSRLADEQTVFSGWDRHGPALLLLAAWAGVMLVGAWRGSRPAMAAVAAAGVAALLIAFVWDAPDLDDVGEVGVLYADASAGAGTGYYLETLGGALLLASGGGLLLLQERLSAVRLRSPRRASARAGRQDPVAQGDPEGERPGDDAPVGVDDR